jgi:hypothetical protein
MSVAFVKQFLWPLSKPLKISGLEVAEFMRGARGTSVGPIDRLWEAQYPRGQRALVSRSIVHRPDPATAIPSSRSEPRRTSVRPAPSVTR